MAKINFMDRENLLRSFEIKDDIVTVGREATNKVVIADPSVSRQHATIERREDGYYLVDKNSSNGTYANGKRISAQKLNHNDKVNFGSASVIFEDEEQVASTFIVSRNEMPEALPKLEAKVLSPNERPTDALDEMMEDKPLPPPTPMISSVPPQADPVVPPPRPQPPAPAPARLEPVPEAPVGILCPTCRKVVDNGARFCGFCGTPLTPKAVPAPPPLPPVVERPAAVPPPIPPPPRTVLKSELQARTPVPSFGNTTSTGLNYAGFGPRLIAYFIDIVIVLALSLLPLLVAFFVAMPVWRDNEPLKPLGILIVFACVFIALLIAFGYLLYFTGVKGATLGKRIMKLKVAFPDGKYPIGYGKAFLRLIGYGVSGLICYIGFLMILFDKEQHRGLHDRMAGTVVIKES